MLAAKLLVRSGRRSALVADAGVHLRAVELVPQRDEQADRGRREGDRLCFAVIEADEAGGCVLAGNVGLKNRDETGRIGERETAEIGYWTALAARGRGVAPAAVRAVTDWVFDAFAGASLRQIMLVHDVDNPASCRVAEKAGYPFQEFSPANPPHWFTDGHIHMRLVG